MVSLICEISDMIHMNLSTKQERTLRHREQTWGCQWAWDGVGFGVSRGKLLCVEWISNNILLYSIGNYINIL